MPPRPVAPASQNAPSGPGIISVNPNALHQQAAKTSARLKVVLRRLPPGLTHDEFINAVGEEWTTSSGKVDWTEYRQGKIRSPGKHPEQSRVYLHFINEAHLKSFEARFLATTFHDAKGTWRHPDLKHLPPALEFAPCPRIPSTKQRVDTRQGLIDQEPEYMAFLEGETQSIPKSTAFDGAPAERTKEAVTSTPLIEALREKKAAKAKAAAAKASKQAREETSSPDKTKTQGSKSRKAAAAETKPVGKVDAKNKETAKSVIKDDKANVSGKGGAAAGSASPTPARKRDRPPTNIKSMLERDLGLASTPRKSKDAPADKIASQSSQGSSSEANAKQSRSTKKDKESTADGKSASQSQPSPRPAKSKPATPASSNGVVSPPTAPASRSSKPAPKPSPGATKAYLKHANASQGITEDLLRTALSTFGSLASLEIDNRKGTALAEFRTAEGLAAAMSKRSITVAQGAVEVLEYRDRTVGQSKAAGTPTRGTPSRGRGRGGGRGGAERPASAAGSAAPG